MTDRELMQQALEALEDSCYPRMSAKHSVRYDEIVTALRERLAQPVQEHVIDCPRCGHCCPQS